jgi:hypothetical protein
VRSLPTLSQSRAAVPRPRPVTSVIYEHFNSVCVTALESNLGWTL